MRHSVSINISGYMTYTTDPKYYELITARISVLEKENQRLKRSNFRLERELAGGLKDNEFISGIITGVDALIYINKNISGKDKKRIMLWSNRKEEELFGYTLDEVNAELLKQGLKDSKKPDHLKVIFDSWDFLADMDTGPYSAVFRVPDRNGRYMWLYATEHKFKWNAGDSIDKYIGIAINITGKINGDKKLRGILNENLKLKNRIKLNRLTGREKEVLELIADGLTNTEIAEKLKLSRHTVDTHRMHLLKKLRVKNTAGLVRFATSCGITRETDRHNY